ncbi:unnamed protein product [Miscanthus lutarioriparius]|uniref:Splicing factor 3B subunit 1 domain-containing protein n=1 Tax=Miscanthus lutarioriparius TaxID=422564 RepID=A0A811NYC2_9POAL|nr:unnamed protein product [Miscanthus lutarioriparius]
MDAIDAELARAQEERRKVEEALAAGAPMAVSSVTFDTDLYGGGGADPDRFAGYDTSIPASEDAAAEDEAAAPAPRRLATYTGHAIAAADLPPSADGGDDGLGLPKRSQRIIDREDDYRRRCLNQIISPERHDPFAAGEATPDPAVRTYADVMRDAALQKKKEDLLREIAKKKEEEERKAATTKKRRNRNRWDETPTPGRMADADATPAAGGATPGATPSGAWDATPKLPGGVTPTPGKKQRSRWDETPASMGSATPGGRADNLATPTPSQIARGPMTLDLYNQSRWQQDIQERNRPLTDEELDAMFPQEGYKILEPPASYQPIRTPARKLPATQHLWGHHFMLFQRRIVGSILICPRRRLLDHRS